MSEEELIGAYTKGRISRRMFVRGLMAAGVSAGAALAYASSLGAAGAQPPTNPTPQQPVDHHDRQEWWEWEDNP